MPSTDAFALGNSGLNEFLFSEVGTELNGSPLTLLSVLGRLGKDPWMEAARLAGLPKASMIDAIVWSISQMPLNPQALADARLTAARLILLLPTQAGPPASAPPGKTAAISRSLTVALLLCAVALGLAVTGTWFQPAAVSPAAISSLAPVAAKP